MKTEPVDLPADWSEDWTRAARSGRCLHCGNALGRHWKPAEGPFCCRGCAGVWELIHSASLERFYDLKPSTLAPAASLRADSFAWLDRIVEERAAAAPGDSVLRLDLDIQGVHCAACVWLIEELFRRQPAGVQVRLNPALGKVEMAWDTARGDLKAFLAELERFGYRLGPARKGVQRHSRSLIMRMAIAIAMAMNVMMFSVSVYLGLDEGLLYTFFGWLSFGMATISLVAAGGVFYRGALAGLRRGVLHLDVPIALGMTLAYAGSVYTWVTGGMEATYFDSLCAFIALMLVGRWAQEHILERNRNSLLESSGAENLTVKRVRAGRLEAVGAAMITLGDELWIAPGDLLPVRGLLLRRPTEAALDWITGESGQVTFQPGEAIPAGAFNASSQGFAVAAAEAFADSRLNDLLRTTSIADEQFRPQWWHRIAGWYVAAVLVAAAGGFALWVGRDVARALEVTIAILVVTCPCALGLATPLAEELTHHRLRRAGVFVRKPSFLEKALAVRRILLDKTGTLTMGRLVLDEAGAAALASLGARDRAVLRHMTARSNHPVSVCVAVALGPVVDGEATFTGEDAEALREVAGQGLELCLDDGTWRLGRPAFAAGGDAAARSEGVGGVTVFTRDGRTLATLAPAEEFKADAAGEIAALRSAGYELYLLSGDAQMKVDRAAAALGLPADRAEGDLDPEAKAARVRALDNHDTLMVGDGLNDSPSFAAAWCAATPAVDRPVLPGKADFFFLGDGIAAIGRSLWEARRLRRVVRDNLVIAIVYNVVAVACCAAGLVTPVAAAIFMPASSLAVVTLTAVRVSRGSSWM
ncbi:MAG: heavy metal translocating P-type ATPase metal-binding domain-containing protein [bacterium]|nr:heavy metal translocating P-type ATPase metal-binding domain-containing protein [bacterium]